MSSGQQPQDNHNNISQQQQQQEELPYSQPTKRLKPSPSPTPNLFCNCYSQSQISLILSGLHSLQSYTKYASIVIRHQQKSIASLQPSLLSIPGLEQLSQRVQKCIDRARVNNKFMEAVVEGYSGLLGEAAKLGHHSEGSESSGVMNLLVEVVREWSDYLEGSQEPIREVLRLVQKHAREYQQGWAGQAPKVLVEGCRMGRLLCELHNLEPQPALVQGCQDRILSFLCCQYFLTHFSTPGHPQTTLYPFIHNFTNQPLTASPYTPIPIPSLPPSCHPVTSLHAHLGTLQSLYSSNSHNNTYNIFISYIANDKITNILKWIQIVYKLLVEGGLAVIVGYASYEGHMIAIGWQEFRRVVGMSQFVIREQFWREELLAMDRGMTCEKLKMYYMVLQK